MKKFLCLTSLLLMSVFTIWAQDVTTLTFTAKQENDAYQKLDSVLVTNITKGWTEILSYPDTLLKLSTDGIHDYFGNDGSVKLYQNTPNPFCGKTDFRMTLNSKEKVNLIIFDLNGKKVAEYNNTLAAGDYTFRTTLSSPQTYLLSAITKAGTTSIKLINMGSTGEDASIQLAQSSPLALDMVKGDSQNSFDIGDNMKYVGYATQKDGSHNVTVEKQLTGSETITFVFPTEIIEILTKVAIKEAKNITVSSVDLVCEMLVADGETVSERGICWGENENPDAEGNHIADSALNALEYTITCAGLENGKTYHFRAYANTSNGMTYSNDTTITTLTAALPTLKIDTISKITETTADVAVTITSNGNLEILANGVVVDTIENPTIEKNAIKVDSKESSFVVNLKDLKADHTYYVKAYAENAQGVAYSEQATFKTPAAVVDDKCPASVTDVEGNTYKTVLIGEQCWMAENMRATTYANGTKLTSGFKQHEEPTMGTLLFYSWANATGVTSNTDIHKNDIQGICPTGWHVPCYDDWNTLCKTVDPNYKDVTTRGAQSQEYKSTNDLAIKLCAPMAWPASTTPGTPGYYATDATGFNTTGFSALPIGYAKTDGTVSSPGSSHMWTSVKGSSQGDVFKFTASGTGITWQWNMNTSTYCGVRCIKNAENAGGGGEIDNPDDTLDLNGKFVILSEQATQTYQLYDVTDPSKPVWQWSPRSEGGYSTFNNPSDVKPVYNGTCIMAVASGGGAVIVRLKDKKVLFYACPSGNPHSIELLPNNRVVVASSTGNKLTVYNIDTTRNMKTSATAVYTMEFDCGHNVVWDEGRKCLWSGGKSSLEKIAYDEATGKLTSIEQYPFPEGNTYAHDFIKIYGQDLYHMTTEQNTYVFDPNKNTFTLCEGANIVNVKSISTGPEGYPTICAIPVTGYGTNNRTWVTPYVLDFNTGAKLMDIKNAEIYKLRWWIWEK